MEICKVRNVEIGTGKPKICVPIVEKNKKNILERASIIVEKNPDIVEFRADWFDGVKNNDELSDVLKSLKRILKDIPVLFTLRTGKEGGEISVSEEEYLRINVNIIENKLADIVDVEVFSYENCVAEIINKSKKNGIKVIGSNHHFDCTPLKAEIVERLNTMKEKEVDICKIAVMPKDVNDVITLIDATAEANKLVGKPVVTMSMSGIGSVTRMSGQIFGSSITFGSVGKVSAPGQIEIDDLRKVLDVIDNSL